jgi:hypothetical protein
MFIQFKDESGSIITTDGNFSLVKDGNRNLAFYGSRGRSVLSDDEFKRVFGLIRMPVPTIPEPEPTDPEYDHTKDCDGFCDQVRIGDELVNSCLLE